MRTLGPKHMTLHMLGTLRSKATLLILLSALHELNMTHLLSSLLQWEIMIIGPNDTLYEGGFLRAELIFPPEYPLLPPKMKFLTKMWHPNGECLSALEVGLRRRHSRSEPVLTFMRCLL